MSLPIIPQGYNPNNKPNITQTILTNHYATTAIIGDIGTNTVTPGMFLSKANSTMNDNTFILPTETSVLAGNLFLITEGVIPDTLGVSSVQGAVNGVLPQFSTGDNCVVVPLPQNGTVAQLQVSFNQGDVVSNNPLYVTTGGSLTQDVNAALAPSSIGFILQSPLTTVATTGLYQTTVILIK